MSQVRAGSAYVELLTKDTAFVKGLRSAQKRLESFGASTRLLGTKLMGLGAAAATPLAGSVAIFSNFDDAMRGVAAITQATGSQLESLRNTAKHLGATTSYSASEVASLMTELGRAGFKPDQIEKMTAAVMNMARATGTDATQASGIMAATIRQFGMEAGEATRVADGLTAAANKSFNTVESLGEALSYAGPVAADANMSLEETLAILGTLGNMGIQGSSAGNAMRRLLTISAAESEKFKTTFGVTTKDAKGNARSLVDVLGEVAAATEKMGTAEKAEKLNEVFGLLGITAASSIGKSVADTRELYSELQKAGGIAGKTAEEMEGGLGGAFRILKSSIEGVAIAIGESLEGSVTTRAQEIWAKRCSVRPAPTWLHPNGGLYLYGSEMYGPMFARIIRNLIPTWGASDQATDESLIVNQLYNDHPGYIQFLPSDFNVSMVYSAAWAINPVMQSYVYHFVGRSKTHIDDCRWQRRDPPELPFPGNAETQELIQRWGNDRPAEYDIGPIFTPQLAANLLAVYPDLIVTGQWSDEPHQLDRRMLSHTETGSSHLVLTRFLLQLGINARRFRLRVKEDANATAQLAGT